MMITGFFDFFRLRNNMIYMRKIYPKFVLKITGRSNISISNFYLAHSFKLRQLIQSFAMFWVFRVKSYVKSHVDEVVFKLLYKSFLHQLSNIIPSAIGTTLFAHVNLENIFVPRKSREAALLFSL